MNYIFIHGLGQTDESWDKVITTLGVQNKHCPNLKSLLNSKTPTFNNLYMAFKQYCDKFSTPLNFCGISLGGILALKYTIENPDKVNSLILIGIQYKIPTLLFTLQGIVFKCLPQSTFASTGFTKTDFITLTNSMKYFNFEKELSGVKCKSMVICGNDDKANKKASVELSKKLLNSKLYLISNAKHEVNIDSPEELTSLLNDFYF